MYVEFRKDMLKITPVLVFIFFKTAYCGSIYKLFYVKLSNSKIDSIVMEIKNSNDTTIVINSEKNSFSKAYFSSKNYLPFSFCRTGAKKSDSINVNWYYDLNRIIFNGRQRPLNKTQYINSGSLFYIFGKIMPDKQGEKTTCNLLSLDGKQSFQVELKNLGFDKISFKNESVTCH
jgi:hypothetical protein